jgi:endonuclease I
MLKNIAIAVCLLFVFDLSAQQVNSEPVQKGYDNKNQPSGTLSDYYASAYKLYGTALRTQLYNLTKNHTVVSYGSLYTYYATTDQKPDGTIWDFYSDVPGGTPAYTYTLGTKQCGNYSKEGDCYNREHQFCEAWYGSQSSLPIYSDLYNVIPTDGYVNNRRSNYPYGQVSSATWTSTNGSKVGPNTSAGYSGVVFEPIDAYKGDIARAQFYVSTRYYTEDASWSTSNGTNKCELLSWYSSLLYKWHMQDTVSQKEIDRNNAVYGIQGKRNPFIDHPKYVAEIWFTTMTPSVVSVMCQNSTSIVIDFSRYLDSTVSVNPNNFIINNGVGSPFQVVWGVNNDISKLLLTTAQLSGATAYTLQVKNLKSINSVAMNDTTISFTTDSSLPVELSSFTGKLVNSGVKLQWQTSTELNNYRFELERKYEDNNWITLTEMMGAGNSNSPKQYFYLDKEIQFNGKYYYRLKQVDVNGNSKYFNEIEVNVNFIPAVYALENNFPNPFNPSTVIRYSLPFESNVRLSVYNSLGQVVINELSSGLKPEGTYDINFNAYSLNSGIYFYTIQANSSDGLHSFTATKKMILMK